NAAGYGLTFGLHTRIDGRVQHVIDRVEAGNIYINRNQIGAVVGSQPFGGHGLSGTGPKAGGPRYLSAFLKGAGSPPDQPLTLPGPTGETNTYRQHPRAGVFCAGPGATAAREQAAAARALGCARVIEAGDARPEDVPHDVSAVLYWGEDAKRWQMALAAMYGPIRALILSPAETPSLLLEQTICVDTTASGGNAALLAASSEMDMAAE
ncbi:MAG: aldehyde dehydrogenase family protein, partial [Pseudomonadota bacterium]